MEIIPIFGQYMFAFCFDEESDEFNRLINNWTDVDWLDTFFTSNKELLEFENITHDEAILETINLAEKLYKLLKDNQRILDTQFRNLDNKVISMKPLEKQKVKRGWLRLYALRIDKNIYVITGGAIKQSLEMKDHPDTKEELKKLEGCKNYLTNEGVQDIDSFFELII